MKLIKISIILISSILLQLTLFAQNEPKVICLLRQKPYNQYDNLVNIQDTVIFMFQSLNKTRHYQFGKIKISINSIMATRSSYNKISKVDTLFFNNQTANPVIEIPLSKYITPNEFMFKYNLENRIWIEILNIYELKGKELNKIKYPYYKLEYEFIVEDLRR